MVKVDLERSTALSILLSTSTRAVLEPARIELCVAGSAPVWMGCCGSSESAGLIPSSETMEWRPALARCSVQALPPREAIDQRHVLAPFPGEQVLEARPTGAVLVSRAVGLGRACSFAASWV
jgi:hypothetical protein